VRDGVLVATLTVTLPRGAYDIAARDQETKAPYLSLHPGTGDMEPKRLVVIDPAQYGIIDAVYADILDRSADADGATYFQRIGANRTQIAGTLAASNERRKVIVEQLYRRLLGRPSDPGGLAYFVGKLGGARNSDRIVAEFAASSEFIPARYDQGDNSWALVMYGEILHRGEFELYWSDLAGRIGRFEAARALLNTVEARRATVIDAYQRLLGRAPEDPGRDYWVGRLQAGVPTEDLLIAIIGTAEYSTRHEA
jgi:hypothetical protein